MKIARNFYNKKTKKTVSIECEYDDIPEILEELGANWVRGSVDKVNFSSNGGRDIYSKADNGWKETLKRIKKKAGKTSTITTGNLGEL